MEHSPLGGELKDDNFERLPGAGKGGMVQLALAGNVSMLFLVLYPLPPPLIIRSAKGEMYEKQEAMVNFH